jgi:hypothetical protein
MKTKEEAHFRVSAGDGNTISDQDLAGLKLSSKQIALLLSQSPEIGKLDEIQSFYDYEKEYVRIVKEIGRQAMEIKLGNVSTDRRKKKHF